MTRDEIHTQLWSLADEVGPTPMEGPSDERGWRHALHVPADPPDGDGHDVDIYISRMPAVFWRVVCEDLGLDLATGSSRSMDRLAADLAFNLANGMLSSR